MCVYMYVCVCVCVCVYIYIYMYTHMNTYIRLVYLKTKFCRFTDLLRRYMHVLVCIHGICMYLYA